MNTIMDEISKNIKKAIKDHPTWNNELIARKIGFADGSGLTNALKNKTLKVNQFIQLAELLGLKPSDLLPSTPENLLIKMPLIDLIKHIVKEELDKNCEILCKKGGR